MSYIYLLDTGGTLSWVGNAQFTAYCKTHNMKPNSEKSRTILKLGNGTHKIAATFMTLIPLPNGTFLTLKTAVVLIKRSILNSSQFISKLQIKTRPQTQPLERI